MAAKTMLCKLGAQRFQALAPLSKVEPFGHERFPSIGLISVEEIGGGGGVVACSVL